MKYCNQMQVENGASSQIDNSMEMKNNQQDMYCVTGITDCAHMLEMCPECVIRCILYCTVKEEISAKIQHTLIEAYCWENEIDVVKVTSTEEITACLHNAMTDVEDGINYDCIIICDRSLSTDNGSNYIDIEWDDDLKYIPP